MGRSGSETRRTGAREGAAKVRVAALWGLDVAGKYKNGTNIQFLGE